MDIDEDVTLLPRAELVKTVVVAPPLAPAPKIAEAAPVAENVEDASIQNLDSSSDDGPRLEYVTHLEMNCDNSQMAAALSSLEVKLYSTDSMALVGQLQGHTGPLTQLAFAPSDSNSLFSASEDGTVRGWDTRCMRTTSTLGESGSGEEVYSMALGYDGRLCAAGKDCLIEFYDLRRAGKPLGTYSDCHTDAVTHVRFHPHKHAFMLTGSEDGLMCFLDTEVSIEEDALDSVMNAECPVRSVGFFGPHGEGVYCCTNTENLSLWHAEGAQRIKDFGDVRALARGQSDADGGCLGAASEAGGGPGVGRPKWAPTGREWGIPVDCIVGCQYDPAADRLRLVTSGFDGTACLATVTPEGITPDVVLQGGHTEQIRTFQWMGRAIATGGEDAKVCSWRCPGGGDDGDNSGAGSASLGNGVKQDASGCAIAAAADDDDVDDAMDDGR